MWMMFDIVPDSLKNILDFIVNTANDENMTTEWMDSMYNAIKGKVKNIVDNLNRFEEKYKIFMHLRHPHRIPYLTR